MVNTRKNDGVAVVKKIDGKLKRSREDYASREGEKVLEDVVVKSSKQLKKGVVKSDLKGKKSGKLVLMEHNELMVSDSDFEDKVNKECKAEDDGAVKLSSANIIPRQKLLKFWDLYYIERHRNFSAKIIYWCDMDVPSLITNKLSISQLEKLESSCLGKFINVVKPQMFSQLIHQVLVREVYQKDSGELWFLLGDKRVRFGLPEFCLISGLRSHGDEDISAFKGMKNRLVSKFFQDEVVTRSSIGKIYREAIFDNDEEAFRMSVIFLVFNYILATVLDNHVDEVLLNFLSYGDFDSYPWGKYAFELTKRSLSVAVKGQVKKGRNGCVVYNFYKENYCRYYKLNGLPYVFQVFLFETIIDLKEKGLCVDDHQSDVRLFKWKELGKPPSFDKLNDLIFSSAQLKIQLLFPTVDENERLDLGGFQFLHEQDGASNIDYLEDDKKGKGADFGFKLDDVSHIVDSRVRPLEKKLDEVKKEILEELRVFRIDILRDIEQMLSKNLRGRFDASEGGKDDGDDDEDKSHDADDLDHGLDDEKLFNVKKDDDIGGTGGDQTGGDYDKIGMKNDNPTFDILEESFGKEMVVYTPIEVGKLETQPISLLDEMVLTTQDIMVCAEVERSASKPCARPVRAASKSAALRSPFTSRFGSAASSCSDVVVSDTRSGISAFPDECMGMPSQFEIALFDQWFKIGLNNRKRHEKFSGHHDRIEPAFTYGSVNIASKMWFFNLKTPGTWLDHDHIDISLYYFRKMAKHSPNIKIRVTTTDCWFHLKLSALYGKYGSNNADSSILTGDGDVAKYIRGYSMDANTPWVNVDFVLFPIHMTGPDHWFLLVFDVHRRVLVVYNSLRPTKTVIRTSIIDVCEPYIFILPIILSKCGFWKDRSDIDFKSAPYIQKGELDLIELEFAEGLPEQIDGDCGMFTLCFAEHFLHQKIEEIPKPFPIMQYRKKLCVNLYIYARNKQLDGYDSDTENRGRFVPVK